MTLRDQTALFGWLQQGRKLLTDPQLTRVIMALIADDVLLPGQEVTTASGSAPAPTAPPVPVATTQAAPAAPSTPAVPEPAHQLSVPKLIIHYAKHSGRAVRAGELLAYVHSIRPDTPRSSVYSALHQLCATKQLRKHGEAKNVTYTLPPEATAKEAG